MRCPFLLSRLLRFDFSCPRCSDIDFEYPSGTTQGRTFANLLTELRSALDALAKSNGDRVPYQLTVRAPFILRVSSRTRFSPSKVAVPAGYENYASLRVAQMNSALNYWNLMVWKVCAVLIKPRLIGSSTEAYDYAGSWSSWVKIGFSPSIDAKVLSFTGRQSGQCLWWCPHKPQHSPGDQMVSFSGSNGFKDQHG